VLAFLHLLVQVYLITKLHEEPHIAFEHFLTLLNDENHVVLRKGEDKRELMEIHIKERERERND